MFCRCHTIRLWIGACASCGFSSPPPRRDHSPRPRRSCTSRRRRSRAPSRAWRRRVGDRLLRRVPRGCELDQHRTAAPAPGAQGTGRGRAVHRVPDHPPRVCGWATPGRLSGGTPRACSGTGRSATMPIELELVRHNAPTAGLAEGLCDVAIVRREVDDKRFDSVVVGLERRLVAFASDDPQWSRRRQLRMAEIADRTVIIDPRVGTTSQPAVERRRPPAPVPRIHRRRQLARRDRRRPRRGNHRRGHRTPPPSPGRDLPAHQGRSPHRRQAGLVERPPPHRSGGPGGRRHRLYTRS